MAAARLIYFGLPEKKFWGIRAIKLTLIFVWLDVGCFLVQLGGGSLLSNDDQKLVRIGMKIYTAGIAVQMVFVVAFSTMLAFFYHRFHQVTAGRTGRAKILIWVLLTVLVLIMVSSNVNTVYTVPGIMCGRVC